MMQSRNQREGRYMGFANMKETGTRKHVRAHQPWKPTPASAILVEAIRHIKPKLKQPRIADWP